MPIAFLQEAPINTAALLCAVTSEQYGAVVLFEGRVRREDHEPHLIALCYNAYAQLASRELERIALEVQSRWKSKCGLVHRTGRVGISEISVAVAVACPHRAEAFEACKWAMDTLKATVPIWKQEIYEDSAVWIEGGKRFEASRRDQ
jgi:molybdopterin synthase catalytic subunit